MGTAGLKHNGGLSVSSLQQAVMCMHCCGTAFLVPFLAIQFISLYTQLSTELLQFQKQ